MDAIISTIWILATLGSMLLVRCFWRNPRADGGRSHQGAAGISKHAQYFIDVYRQSFSVGTFSTVLGLQDVQLVGINKNVSSFFFILPERLCLLPKKRLCASVVAAMFDELSTYGIIGGDTCCRPGVSVALSTELVAVAPVPSGTTLTMHCTLDKIGKNIAFSSMVLIDSVKTRSPSRTF